MSSDMPICANSLLPLSGDQRLENKKNKRHSKE